MQKKSTRTRSLYINSFRFLVLVILVIGIFFRFINIDRKVYWYDETFTSLRISGYTEAEVAEQVFDGHEIGVEDLQKYQRLNPEKGVNDTVKSLAIEEAQLPPLYFVMARLWVQWFGSSVAVTRSLSAVISLLMFPCIYWLCLELFESSLVGEVAIALIAVSPLHIMFAQEARMYSLWTVTILVSSASLLRAMRLKTRLSWGVYAATVALGLYSHLYFLWVAVAHGIYVVIIERFRLSKTLTTYLLASLAGFITFVPWVLIIIDNLSQVKSKTAWANSKNDRFSLITGWLGDFGRIFIDVGIGHDSDNLSKIILLVFILIMLVIAGYSFYFLLLKTQKQVWLFVVTLTAVPALVLMLPDLIFGGVLSTAIRYLIPSSLGVQLAVSYLLATKITFVSVGILGRKLWQLVIVTLLSVGVLSYAISSQSEVWWNKISGLNKYNPQVARIINQTPHPLLISSGYILNDTSFTGSIFSLSHLLEPKVRLQLTVEPNVPRIADGFSDVFLYDEFVYKPDYTLQRSLEKEYEIKSVYRQSGVWLCRLEKK